MGKLLVGRRHRILASIETLRDLHQRMMQDDRQTVIVHTDPTRDNVIFGAQGEPYLIDWDGVRLGWPEADLIYYADDQVLPTVLDEYAQYVPYSLRSEAFAYYMYDRLIADIWDRIPSILDLSLSEPQRRHELEMLEDESSRHDLSRSGMEQITALLRNV
jgi:thiamine kinase-like enzyme